MVDNPEAPNSQPPPEDPKVVEQRRLDQEARKVRKIQERAKEDIDLMRREGSKPQLRGVVPPAETDAVAAKDKLGKSLTGAKNADWLSRVATFQHNTQAMAIAEELAAYEDLRNDPDVLLQRAAVLAYNPGATADAQREAADLRSILTRRALERLQATLQLNPRIAYRYRQIITERIYEDPAGQPVEVNQWLKDTEKVTEVKSRGNREYEDGLPKQTVKELYEDYRMVQEGIYTYESNADQLRDEQDKKILEELRGRKRDIEDDLELYVDAFRETTAGDNLGTRVEQQAKVDRSVLQTAESAGKQLNPNVVGDVFTQLRTFKGEENALIRADATLSKFEGISEYMYFEVLEDYGVRVRRSEVLLELSGNKAATLTEYRKFIIDELKRRNGIEDFEYERGDLAGTKIKGAEIFKELQKVTEDEDVLAAARDFIFRKKPDALTDFNRGLRREHGDDTMRRFKDMWIHPKDRKNFEEAWKRGVENHNFDASMKQWLENTVYELISSTDEPIRGHPETQQRLNGLSFLIADLDQGFEAYGYPRGTKGEMLQGMDKLRTELLDQIGAFEDVFNLGYVQMKAGGEGSIKALLPLYGRLKPSETLTHLMEFHYNGRSVLAEGRRFLGRHMDEIIQAQIGDKAASRKMVLQLMQQMIKNGTFPRDMNLALDSEVLGLSDKQKAHFGDLFGPNGLLGGGKTRLGEADFSILDRLPNKGAKDHQVELLYSLVQMNPDHQHLQRVANFGFKLARAWGFVDMEIQANMWKGGYNEFMGGQDYGRRLIHYTRWALRWGLHGGNTKFWEAMVKEHKWDDVYHIGRGMELRRILGGEHIHKPAFLSHHEVEHFLKHKGTIQPIIDDIERRLGEKLPKDFLELFDEKHVFWFDDTTFDLSATRHYGPGWRTQDNYRANMMMPVNNSIAMKPTRDGIIGDGPNAKFRPLTRAEAETGANVKNRIKELALHREAKVRAHANGFRRFRSDYNAEGYAYYRLSKDLGITPQQLRDQDFTSAQAEAFKTYYEQASTAYHKEAGDQLPPANLPAEIQALMRSDRLNVSDATIQYLVNQKYAQAAPEQSDQHKILKDFFVVPPNRVEAPSGDVRWEDVDYTEQADDLWWRQARDMESAENAFPRMIGVIQNIGQRAGMFNKALEGLDMVGNIAPHKGQDGRIDKNKMITDKFYALHRTRLPHPLWNGYLGKVDVQDWEYESAKKWGIQTRFMNVPLVGRFLTKNSVPLNRSQVSSRTEESGWGPREIYDHANESVDRGVFTAGEKEELAKKYKQININRAWIGGLMDPLLIFGGFFEGFKKFREKLSQVYDKA